MKRIKGLNGSAITFVYALELFAYYRSLIPKTFPLLPLKWGSSFSIWLVVLLSFYNLSIKS